MHPFTGIQISEKGIETLVDYVAKVREVIGYEIPLAVDHFGHIGLESCIRLGRALDRFSLAWYEDMIPWQYPDQFVRLSQSVATPICTGEDIYLKEGFKPLLESRGVAVIHPDLATSGGILETKKIGDMAQEYGVAMAMHQAGSPISMLANVHCAAATEGFLGSRKSFCGYSKVGVFARWFRASFPEQWFYQSPRKTRTWVLMTSMKKSLENS